MHDRLAGGSSPSNLGHGGAGGHGCCWHLLGVSPFFLGPLSGHPQSSAGLADLCCGLCATPWHQPEAWAAPRKQGVRVSRRQDKEMKGGQMMEEVLTHGFAAAAVSEL